MEPIQFVLLNRDGRRLYGIAVTIVYLAFMSNLASAAPQMAPDAKKTQAQSNYGKLPLSFEANQGQTDAQVKFLAHGQGYVLFLTPTEAVLSLKKSQTRARDLSFTKFSPSTPPNAKFSPSTPPNTKFSPSPFMSSSSQPKTIGTVLRMQFIGANPAPQLLGEEALPGQVNYLIGNDPGRWLTRMPTYAKVTYEGLYPGVNLVYYGNQGQLEYDFVVAPGSDPSQVKLTFKGADKIEISPTGELILHTAIGELRMHKPVIYQEIGGVRKSVKGGYVLKAGQTVSFHVAAYDAAYPLIIDPVLVYSTYLGGRGDDQGNGISVDNNGRAYVTGITLSPDFPTVNALQPDLSKRGSDDAFVAQLTADGTALRYATYLGGSEFDSGRGIAVDKKGQAYVIGETHSTDFPTANALQPVFGGPGRGLGDAFVAQLTADGAGLRYSTYLGGNGRDNGLGIAVDQRGQASVTGVTESTDFQTVSALQPVLNGVNDAFVAQLTADGAALRYATYLGGSEIDLGSGIAVDNRGQVYVTGRTISADFPIVNALQPTLNGLDDGFVVKLTADGAALSYATYLGGNGGDSGNGIAVDQRGQAYVTGFTESTDFPTVNALQPTFGGGFLDAFIAQLTADGAELRYATYLGGSKDDNGLGIAVDQRGQAAVTGVTESADFPTVNALQPTFGGGFNDAFVAQLTSDGAALRYASYLGGSRNENGRGIAVDQQGQAYVTGFTDSPADFPTMNALQPVFGGVSDAFVTKIGNGN
jgi:hypothetical protein